jgi:hypothetical protein
MIEVLKMQEKTECLIRKVVAITILMFWLVTAVISTVSAMQPKTIDSVATTEYTTKEVTTTKVVTTQAETTEVVTTTEVETTEKQTTEVSTKESTTQKVTTTNEITTEAETSKSASSSEYSIPDNGGRFKSYTNYRLLNKNSSQWNKIQCHEDAYADDNGLRKVGNYYCVAMGSYYSTTLGDTFEITTEGGTFQVVICDFKANRHTDSTNRYTAHNGCVVEFYVDMNTLDSTARRMGDISYADGKFSGRIINITKIGNIFN